MMSFETCIAIVNPASTAQEQTKRLLAEVRKHFDNTDFRTITTPKGERADIIAALQDELSSANKQTLICIGGGDGTVGIVVEALVTSKDTRVAEAAILPLWGGNANDIAFTLNGTPEKNSISHILTHGHVQALYPLVCTIETSSQQQQYIAASYISFGATAFAAHQLNQPEHRERLKDMPPLLRFMREAARAGRALNESAPFTITQNNTDIPAYDYLFTKGSRIAKVFPAPSRPHKPVYHSKLLRYKRPLHLLRHFVELAWPGADRHNITHDTVLTLHEDTWAQFDGEAVQLPADATVHISISKRPFHGVSTTLK